MVTMLIPSVSTGNSISMFLAQPFLIQIVVGNKGLLVADIFSSQQKISHRVQYWSRVVESPLKLDSLNLTLDTRKFWESSLKLSCASRELDLSSFESRKNNELTAWLISREINLTSEAHSRVVHAGPKITAGCWPVKMTGQTKF